MGSIIPSAMSDNVRWKAIPETQISITSDSSRCSVQERYRKDPEGNLVAPYSVGQGPINRFDHVLMKRIASEHLCSACGEPLRDIAAFPKDHEDLEAIQDALLLQGRDHQAEAPMHVECAGYAMLACPHMREGAWSVILATSWGSVVDCEEDGGRSEFWPNLDAPHEILTYEAFVTRVKESQKAEIKIRVAGDQTCSNQTNSTSKTD